MQLPLRRLGSNVRNSLYGRQVHWNSAMLNIEQGAIPRMGSPHEQEQAPSVQEKADDR
jgi:hypothetical protein